MTAWADDLIKRIAQELHIPPEMLGPQDPHLWLDQRFREVEERFFEITKRYGISGIHEVDARYQDGSIAEADSWQDYQELDHLEYKRDVLMAMLEDVNHAQEKPTHD